MTEYDYSSIDLVKNTKEENIYQIKKHLNEGWEVITTVQSVMLFRRVKDEKSGSRKRKTYYGSNQA